MKTKSKAAKSKAARNGRATKAVPVEAGGRGARSAQVQALPGLAGTGLTGDDFKPGGVVTARDEFTARYGWDTGHAIGLYLDGLKNCRLMGTRCDRCRRTMVPARSFCELCFHPVREHVALKDTGTVNTFSLCSITWNMERVSKPLMPAVIEIDGASPGMGILHLLGGVEPSKVRVGMRVRAVWKPASERVGAITDIRCFEPI